MFLEKYIQKYIWHRDEFNLVARPSNTSLLSDCNSEPLPSHLYGITYYGDNIEDEWFIVFMLVQLTKEFQDIVVRVVDSDGEFLLIEAANYLPEWADPETCDKRVYIHNGCLHIVAPEADDEVESITVGSAINEIRKDPSLTMVTKMIQECINKRIREYPQKNNGSLHKTAVYVPIAVASILRANPKIISPAVRAFCNRDQIDMKACRAMKYFPPEVRVLTRVTFTKCLYAMLVNSKYQPDRKTGWNLPPPTAKAFKAYNLGVKLACGFEILLSQSKSTAGDENDKNWKAYQRKLQEKGYFNGLLEHSKEYNQLLNKAKEYYSNHMGSDSGVISVGEQVSKLLQSLDYNTEEYKKEAENLPPDDDDSWLNIHPDELDSMLEEQYGNEKTLSLNGETNPTEFTQNVESFLNHVSSFEGAEFPKKDEAPIRPPRTNKRANAKVSFSTDTKAEETSTKVNFDPSSFACAVQNILNFVIPEDDSWDFDTDSDMSDYDTDENGTNGELNKMQELMDAMDKELAKTTIGESFLKKDDNESFEDIEAFKPVDIDMNALKNILESYQSQLGEAGPSSNMLGPMGIHLDENKCDGTK
ncbi:putative SGT1 protein [Trypoxylus dichotomus]